MRFVYNISIMAYTSSSDLQVYSSYSWDWLWRIWDAHFTLCRLSPRLFGEPTNRDRWWRILFDEKKYQWNCAYSFAELTEILLLPPQTPLTVTPEVFFGQGLPRLPLKILNCAHLQFNTWRITRTWLPTRITLTWLPTHALSSEQKQKMDPWWLSRPTPEFGH